MAIDWEVEYNNRARVPEHPQIFAHGPATAPPTATKPPRTAAPRSA